jgi:hypothetical protein
MAAVRSEVWATRLVELETALFEDDDEVVVLEAISLTQ